jgi:hypothetical protein
MILFMLYINIEINKTENLTMLCAPPLYDCRALCHVMMNGYYSDGIDWDAVDWDAIDEVVRQYKVAKGQDAVGGDRRVREALNTRRKRKRQVQESDSCDDVDVDTADEVARPNGMGMRESASGEDHSVRL